MMEVTARWKSWGQVARKRRTLESLIWAFRISHRSQRHLDLFPQLGADHMYSRNGLELTYISLPSLALLLPFFPLLSSLLSPTLMFFHLSTTSKPLRDCDPYTLLQFCSHEISPE